jgi:hypothetical protein
MEDNLLLQYLEKTKSTSSCPYCGEGLEVIQKPEYKEKPVIPVYCNACKKDASHPGRNIEKAYKLGMEKNYIGRSNTRVTVDETVLAVLEKRFQKNSEEILKLAEQVKTLEQEKEDNMLIIKELKLQNSLVPRRKHVSSLPAIIGDAVEICKTSTQCPEEVIRAVGDCIEELKQSHRILASYAAASAETKKDSENIMDDLINYVIHNCTVPTLKTKSKVLLGEIVGQVYVAATLYHAEIGSIKLENGRYLFSTSQDQNNKEEIKKSWIEMVVDDINKWRDDLNKQKRIDNKKRRKRDSDLDSDDEYMDYQVLNKKIDSAKAAIYEHFRKLTPWGEYLEHRGAYRLKGRMWKKFDYETFKSDFLCYYRKKPLPSEPESEEEETPIDYGYVDKNYHQNEEEHSEEPHTPVLEEQLYEGLNEPVIEKRTKPVEPPTKKKRVISLTDTEKRRELLDMFRSYDEDGQTFLINRATSFLQPTGEYAVYNIHLH